MFERIEFKTKILYQKENRRYSYFSTLQEDKFKKIQPQNNLKLKKKT